MHPSIASGDVVSGGTCVRDVNVIAGPPSIPAHPSEWRDGPEGALTESAAQ